MDFLHIDNHEVRIGSSCHEFDPLACNVSASMEAFSIVRDFSVNLLLLCLFEFERFPRNHIHQRRLRYPPSERD